MNSPLAEKLAKALVLDDRLLADSLLGGAVDDLIANIIDAELADLRDKHFGREIFPRHTYYELRDQLLIPEPGHPSDFLQN